MPRSSLFHSIATLRMLGTACLSSSRRLVLSVVALSDIPVTLPPGRAKLATRPLATGSPAPTATTVETPVPFIAAAGGHPRTTTASTPCLPQYPVPVVAAGQAPRLHR